MIIREHFILSFSITRILQPNLTMIREFIIDTNNTAICHRGMVDGGGEKNIWKQKIFEPRLLRRRSPVAAG